MKKFIKSRIFSFLLGAIIFSTITAYAGSLMNSNEVTFTPRNNKWNVTKVDEALNSLYSVAVPEEYTGSTSITPTYSDITLNTQDKLVKNNITISGIPSTYKNLTNTTTGTSSDIATGKTLYNSNGELITGTAVLGGDCVYGEITVTADCNTSEGCIIFEGFNPSKFIMKLVNPTNNTKLINYYNASEDPNNFYQFTSTPSYKALKFSDSYRIENNKLIAFNGGTTFINKTRKYIVCK